MATLNQQMDDLLSPDDMMLQGMEEGTFEQAKEDTKEFAKSVVKGSATAPIMVPVDVVDLGVMAPALKDEVKPFFPTYSGIEEAFEQLSAMGFSRKNATKWLADNTGIQLKGDYGEVVGEFISPAAATNTAVKGLKTLASVATKYGNDVPFTISRIEDEAKKLFNTASGGDDLDGMAPAVVGDAPTPTATADTTELPDTSTTKMMVGEKGSVGEDAIFRYERLKNEDPDLTKEELYAQTGVYMGRDGMPRYELDTQEAKLIDRSSSDSFIASAGLDSRTIPSDKNFRIEALEDGDFVELKQIIDFPSLFNQYSDVEAPIQNIYSAKPFGADYDPIENIEINIEKMGGSSKAYYSPESDTITISADLVDKPEEFLSVLLHEVQHAVQHREGFSTGSNVSMFYKRAGFELGYDDINLDSDAAWQSRWDKATTRTTSGMSQATRNFKQNSPVFKKDQTDADTLEDPATLMVMSLNDFFAKRMDNDSYKKGKVYSDEEKKLYLH